MTVRESINSIKDFLICTQPCSAMRGGDASRVMQARCDVESVDLTSVALYGGGLSGGAMPHIVAAFSILASISFAPLARVFCHVSGRCKKFPGLCG